MTKPIPGNPNEGKIAVVLNGGKDELESAIVPFTFGFDDTIIEKNPTHVLIIDRTFQESKYEAMYANEFEETKRGKRYFISLSQPGNCFIEFFKSGEHNLLFVFYNLSAGTKKDIAILEDSLLEKSPHNKTLYQVGYKAYVLNNQFHATRVAYCEKDVYIPTEFFSETPKSMFGKIFFDWVNMWRRDKPADQCEFRDRALRALTYELIPRVLWLLIRHIVYFFVRLLIAIIFTVLSFISKSIVLFAGFQSKNFFEGTKKMWYDFLIKENDFEDAVGGQMNIFDKHKFKEIKFKDKKFYTPISLLGLVVFLFAGCHFIQSFGGHFSIHQIVNTINTFASFIFLILQTCFIIETSNFINKFRDKVPFKKTSYFDVFEDTDLYTFVSIASSLLLLVILFLYALVKSGFVKWLFGSIFSSSGLVGLIIITSILLLVYVIFKLEFLVDKSILLFDFLGNKWGSLMDKINLFLDKKFPYKENDKKAPSTYNEWLKDSYNMDKLPSKITSATLPKAQTASGRMVQTFKSKFWDTKSKVCKPYEN